MYCCENCGRPSSPRQAALTLILHRPHLGGTVGPINVCTVCHEGYGKGIPLSVLKRKYVKPVKPKFTPPPVEVTAPPPLALQPTRPLPTLEEKGKGRGKGYPAKKRKRLVVRK